MERNEQGDLPRESRPMSSTRAIGMIICLIRVGPVEPAKLCSGVIYNAGA